jgi:hypothetical protein
VLASEIFSTNQNQGNLDKRTGQKISIKIKIMLKVQLCLLAFVGLTTTKVSVQIVKVTDIDLSDLNSIKRFPASWFPAKYTIFSHQTSIRILQIPKI